LRIREKRKPHYNLKELIELSKNKKTRLIRDSALEGANDINFSPTEMLEVIQSLKNENFYKSMTTITSYKIWQDVYHAEAKGIKLYIKLQKSDDGKCVVISFKKK